MKVLKQPRINKVFLAARLTKDPDLRYTQNGKAICRVSVAFDDVWKQGEKWQKHVNYINLQVWGDQAERVAKLTKGDPVYIEGKLKLNSYEKDGVRKSNIEITAEKILSLEKEANNQGNSGSGFDDQIPF